MMIRVRVRCHGMHYVNNCPHNDGSTSKCVCMFVCVDSGKDSSVKDEIEEISMVCSAFD